MTPFTRLDSLLQDPQLRDQAARVRIGIARGAEHQNVGGRGADLVVPLADALEAGRAVDLQLALGRAFCDVKQCGLDMLPQDLAEGGHSVYAAVFFTRSGPTAQAA